MYNDAASDAPLYLVPNREGTGKRLVRRPHPPPTTAPLPDDFDAITVTRGGTTVHDPADSALDIDYDDMTVEQGFGREMPLRRAGSPTRSLGGELLGARPGLHKGKANSVAGGMGERPARKSLGGGGKAKAPTAGRVDLVQKKVLEDGPERTISVWREGVAKSASEQGDGEGEVKSEVDSHAGRRRVSVDERKRNGLNGLGLANLSLNGKESAGPMTEKGPRSPQQRSFSGASSPPQTNMSRISPPQIASPQKALRAQPSSPSRGPPKPDYTTASSDGLSTSQSRANGTSTVEAVLSTCQPSLLHIAPILEELGVRRSDHLRALARMSEETRDREVKEEALKKGITVVEWAIFLDKLQSL
ncbi:hypothetical protein BV25DRAFT_1562483 [Artomyces pyxidatus]|uniref:Uncharacterized protein n=1 Tax=Artomyces pyxidatus TaxID=48021 RepID=A0ACB8SKZ5_9AGAM|nr:hypothetical protein BV25DRAFT_1562483 [Artomyces pyxidatus]